MEPVDLIMKKRDGSQLSRQEMEFFITGASQDIWPDYQVAAMLMAMYLRGLSITETSDLTLAMAASGDQLDLSGIPGRKVDKHSTGGVGDTATLVLAPLVAACGVPTVKMSGRGLGFTGGTIDKLESIPGFNTTPSIASALELARQNGLVIMGQTENLTPADKKLYALRDVTGTVDSIPLIAASIMSKKIAAGADAIVLDVKCGSGAFMQDLDQARELARTMVGIGQEAGRSVVAVISSMDQPLGNSIGNTLEVAEAIRVLKGDASPDLWQVCLALGQEMLLLAGRAKTEAEAGQALQKARDSGAALARLADFLKGQGADPALAKEPGLLPQPTWTKTFSAPQGGYLTRIDTAGLGHLFVALGGGRRKKDDPIDYTAGFTLLARLGQQVKAGAPLVRVQANDQAKLDQVMARLPDIFSFAKSPDPVRPVILQIIRPDDISAGML